LFSGLSRAGAAAGALALVAEALVEELDEDEDPPQAARAVAPRARIRERRIADDMGNSSGFGCGLIDAL
jgi:hypothetical protein